MTIANQDIKTKYEPFDGCFGVVTERCRAGAYLQLDNGEEAWKIPGLERIEPSNAVISLINQRNFV